MLSIRTLVAVPQTKTHISAIIDHPDLGPLIFSKLRPSDLIRSSGVCRRWAEMAIRIIPKIISPDTRDDLLPLMKNNVITIKELVKVSRVARFVNRCQVCRRNQQFISFQRHYPFATRPYTKYGHYEFTVLEDDHIHVQNKETSFYLRDPNYRQICAMAVDNEFVFALTGRGYLLQWNYLTRKLVKIHETAFKKRQTSWSSLDGLSKIKIGNGWLIMTFSRSLSDFDKLIYEGKLLSNLDISFTVDKGEEEEYPYQVRIINDQLCYLDTSSFHYGDKRIKIDSAKHKLTDYAIQKDRVYLSDIMGGVYVCDLNSQKELKRFSSPTLVASQFHKIEVCQNYLMLYEPKSNIISIYDVNTMELLSGHRVEEGILRKMILFILNHRLTSKRECNVV